MDTKFNRMLNSTKGSTRWGRAKSHGASTTASPMKKAKRIVIKKKRRSKWTSPDFAIDKSMDQDGSYHDKPSDDDHDFEWASPHKKRSYKLKSELDRRSSDAPRFGYRESSQESPHDGPAIRLDPDVMR